MIHSIICLLSNQDCQGGGGAVAGKTFFTVPTKKVLKSLVESLVVPVLMSTCSFAFIYLFIFRR